MQGVNRLKSLKAPVLLAASSLLLGASLSACQSTIPTYNTAHMPASPQSSVDLLAARLQILG